ncbi:hypothetical protein D039_1044B, partial [Vibrio parahaemolyticus EKP-028]
PKSLEG